MITKDREYRTFSLKRSDEGEEQMLVEGYAVVFDTPTVLYNENGIDYLEVVDRHCFDGVSLADVVMNYNHTGKPVARTKNGTLNLSIDDKGLFASATLSGTEEGRKLYEEIRGGYIDKMSFCFEILESFYDALSHTRRITKIARLYDVAAVDIPAYEETTVYARNHLSMEVEKEKAEALKLRRKRISIKNKIKNGGTYHA